MPPRPRKKDRLDGPPGSHCTTCLVPVAPAAAPVPACLVQSPPLGWLYPGMGWKWGVRKGRY